MALAAIWLAFGRLTSEHYFLEESGRQSLMWYVGMWNVLSIFVSYPPPHPLLPFFFFIPVLFKLASEHLNDQNAAAWLSAPVLSNLDGYVSVSEWGRRRRNVHTTQNNLHVFVGTHTDLPTSPALLSRQANASRHTQQLIRAEKWKNVLPSGDAVNHRAVQNHQLSVQLETRGQKATVFFVELSVIPQL